MPKTNAGFSFEKDADALMQRTDNDYKVLIDFKGTRSERMEQFLMLHAQKAKEAQTINK